MKKLIASLIAAASIFAPTASLAENTFDDHVNLWTTLQDVGVTTMLNHKIHCNRTEKMNGVYFPFAAMLVICQDLAKGTDEAYWTKNDLDTLRHESHHIVQDCAIGGLGDGKAGLLFADGNEFNSVVLPVLGATKVQQIRKDYSFLSERDVRLELEAFAVADTVPAASIAAKIKQFCKM